MKNDWKEQLYYYIYIETYERITRNYNGNNPDKVLELVDKAVSHAMEGADDSYGAYLKRFIGDEKE